MRPAPFLVAGHGALDFLNSRAAPDGVTTEWIADGNDLLSWLDAADMVDADTLQAYRTIETAVLDQVAVDARELREWWRRFVGRHAGTKLRARALSELGPLNDLLATDRAFTAIERAAPSDDQPFTLRFDRQWDRPGDLLLAVGEIIADLVVNGDFALVKACAGPRCTLHFYDRTKAHSRRWCSMTVCGNRAKATTHRARLRASA
jgi:predicted RNA-binding Zn ribbon-like protein